MKKILAALLALIMILALCSCGSTNTDATNEPGKTATETPKDAAEPMETEEPAEETIRTIQIGEKITTDNYEFILYDARITNFVEYHSYEGGKRSDNPLTGTLWLREKPYCVQISAYVKNLSKQSVKGLNIFNFYVDYNGGYIYECDPGTFRDSEGLMVELDGYPTHENMKHTTLDALQERYVYGYVQVPDEAYTNTDAPLYVVVKLFGSDEYRYELTPSDHYPTRDPY